MMIQALALPVEELDDVWALRKVGKVKPAKPTPD
jgi:hypothetical protein